MRALSAFLLIVPATVLSADMNFGKFRNTVKAE